MPPLLAPDVRRALYAAAVAGFGVLTILNAMTDAQTTAWLNLVTAVLAALALVNADWSNLWGIVRGSVYSVAAAAFTLVTIYGVMTDAQTTAWLTLIQSLVALLSAANVPSQVSSDQES